MGVRNALSGEVASMLTSSGVCASAMLEELCQSAREATHASPKVPT